MPTNDKTNIFTLIVKFFFISQNRETSLNKSLSYFY